MAIDDDELNTRTVLNPRIEINFNNDKYIRIRFASLNIGGASFGSGIGRKEASIIDVCRRQSIDGIFLVETDIVHYKQYKSLNMPGYAQYASSPVTVTTGSSPATPARKVRVVCLAREGVFSTVRQMTSGVGNRQEVWLELNTRQGRKYCVAGIYSEWGQGEASRPGRDHDGFLHTLEQMAGERVIVLGDFNRCALKAENGKNPEHSELEEMTMRGYKIVHAGNTYHKQHLGTITWQNRGICPIFPSPYVSLSM